MNEDEIVIPTADGMCISSMTYLSVNRTTLCDIMCTSNTEHEYKTKTLKKTPMSISAVLPYQILPTINKKNMESSTLVEKFKYAMSQDRRNDTLKNERKIFLQKMERERKAKERRMNTSATKIQALFRGYLSRNPASHVKRQKSEWNTNPMRALMDLQEELCSWAEFLELKPIAGLSLENRGKKSKRRARIELAACIRIQSFFRMVHGKMRRRELEESIRRRKGDRAAKSIQRFFKWVMKQRSQGELIASIRQRSAMKIQTRFRIFKAKQRVRSMKRLRLQSLRVSEASYKIIFCFRRFMLQKKLLLRINQNKKTTNSVPLPTSNHNPAMKK